MIPFLQLLQLTDSAVPIGGAAHSFGLESLVEWNGVDERTLEAFMLDLLREQGAMDACFCRAAFAAAKDELAPPDAARALGARLSATRSARESREASMAIGRRLLALCMGVLESSQGERLSEAFAAADPHHLLIFGYVGALLGQDLETVVVAWLHQLAAATISVAQRLLPVGQRQAASVLWNLNECIVEIARESRGDDLSNAGAFMPLLEIGSMRHPHLETRLFLS